MADTTTPVTPPANDLQINLEAAPKEKVTPVAEAPKSEPSLDLDLNLPEAPKNDDRLKSEDEKNNEPVAEVPAAPVVETPPPTAPEVKTPLIEQITETIPTETPSPAPQPVAETKLEEIIIPAAETPAQPTTEETIAEQPSTTITEEPITAEAPRELKEDMAIINDLEAHASTGGLSPEAKVEIQPAAVETPKTFDLDAMLGTPPTPTPVVAEMPIGTTPTETVQTPPVVEAQPVVEQKVIQPEIPQMMPTATVATPVMPPAFTIPTTETQVPIQAIPQVTIPQTQTKGVKTLLFVVLFAALGFTTYFILKTMYPIEFGNMFGGDTQMHASEEVTGTVEEMTWAEELLTGETAEETGVVEEMTGTEEATETETTDTSFWELNDLGTTEQPAGETDISRLTEYVNKGNELLAQGKAIGNNTVIKYGLYISKKATSLLEKIAMGEEISNVSWYFAQFDTYITKLEGILGGSTPEEPENTNLEETASSPTENVNGLQGMNEEPLQITTE